MSAALFGVSTPAAKVLVGSVHPAVLAGLLYCGAGAGIAILRRAWPSMVSRAPEVAISRRDLPWLGAAIAAGGVLGPLLLMLGLGRTDAATSSLLLTFEGATTALMAWFIFHENFDRRIALGMICLIAGAAIVSWQGTPTLDSLTGPLAIIGACVFWGLDNNLTRKVSLADPLQIVELKGLIAGPFNLALGLLLGGALPNVAAVLAATFVGFVGYGVSLVLFVFALRDLGTARTGAYFATAPFIGSAVSVAALAEPITAQLLAAGCWMAVGVWLHLSERHEHEHAHEAMAHAHPHVHDEHHQHAHDTLDPPGEPHTHFHEHKPMRHAHPHVPDMHHTHRH
ncbi:DMT(drug/metabolite transporter) superfamily permease [Rhodoplanes sp. Z2-YC6860]|nr:DMT(drug/metabolite transporter) superfamily permease [Rhodoplanes sp. Z2-YC6860]